jgi:hypothetical protein
MLKASAVPAGKDQYDVTMQFVSKKWYADSTGRETAAPMKDYIDIGIFAAETRDKEGRKKTNPLFLQKYKLSPGQQTIKVRVSGKPVKAGIDPYNKLIDRIPDDNLADIDE